MSLTGIGRILAQAREQAGLSTDEAAARMRLSVRQVEALESGNVEALPGPAFVRGFIRNYAKLLQVDAQPLLEATRDMAPDIERAHISLHTENILIEGRESTPWRSYVMIAVLLAAMVALWMWYSSTPNDAQQTVSAVEESVPEEQSAQFIELPPPAPVAPTVPETPPAPDASVPVQEPQAAPVAAENVPPVAVTPPSAAAGAKLQLTCSQDGWVSVHDRDGKQIFNKTIRAGDSAVVEGTPPFKVVLGNAIGMQVSYNNVPVDLALHTNNTVARFTLE